MYTLYIWLTKLMLLVLYDDDYSVMVGRSRKKRI